MTTYSAFNNQIHYVQNDYVYIYTGVCKTITGTRAITAQIDSHNFLHPHRDVAELMSTFKGTF